MKDGEPLSGEYVAAVSVCVSVLIIMLIGLLLYVTCSRRFKLNWFEKTQLETAAKMEKDVSSSLGSIPVAASECQLQEQSTQRQLGNRTKFFRSQSSGKLDSPTSSSQEFWVPVSIQRQASFCHSDGHNELSGEDSLPETPNTPLGIKISPFALSHMSVQDRGVSPLVKNVQPPSSTPQRRKFVTMCGKLDHTKIDTTLYQKKDDSIEEPEEGPGGSLYFSASYNPQFSLLCVHLIRAQNLVAKDISGTADPYAKVRLLPDTSVWRESSTQWKTLHPIFDEEVVFDAPEADLRQRVLEILIFDFDHYSRHQCLGRVHLPLSEINLTDCTPIWKGIDFCDQKDDKPDLGDLMFSLGYLKSAERLTVVVIKARNLRTLDETKTALDPYVKVAILQNGRRLKKKKTNVQRGTLNPVFNEALSFNGISKETLKSLTLEISVMNDNILGQNDVLGLVIIGPLSKGEEATHRRNVLAQKPALALWHSLTLTAPTNYQQGAE